MDKKTVVVLATGGTIAGAGTDSRGIVYKSGTISLETLLSAIPELSETANIEAIQICNINSDDITTQIWFELVKKINDLAKREDVAGFVITHGTDIMEETAYFLNLTVKTAKPVIVTGAMRPPTAIDADGNANLSLAVRTAASQDAYGKGVLVAFAGKVIPARHVQKYSADSLDAITTNGSDTPSRHTLKSEFDISKIKELPKVSIIYFHAEADAELLEFAAKRSEGIVIAGAGAGEFSLEFADVINNLEIPVVISTRTNSGNIHPEHLICKDTISALTLPPAKAAVLLRLALCVTTDRAELARIFWEY